jgi:Dolichyl-phosphate-mannose-protein mannosyltransferase
MNNIDASKEVLTGRKQWIFIFIITIGILLRLYGITAPLLDSHQLRQTQTAMMAKNIYADNMNIFKTRLDFVGDKSNYIIFEFPLMHGISALLYNIFGVHDVIGRLVSVAFSIGALFMIYGLARYFLSIDAALVALTVYTLSPMDIFFSRAFMPESSAMFLSIAAMYFFYQWIDKGKPFAYYLSIFCVSLGCISKPPAGLVLAPIFVTCFINYSWNVFKRLSFWCYFTLPPAVFISWAMYANYINAQGTNAPYSSSWISILGNIQHITYYWFKFDFYFFIGSSIFLLLLTPLGFIGMGIGLFSINNKNKKIILYAWAATIIGYFLILSTATSGHIYYHLPLLPLAAILAGYASTRLINNSVLIERIKYNKLVISLILIVLIGYGVGYYKYFSYMYDTNLRMPYTMEVAKIIKEKTNKSDGIILMEPNVATGTTLGYYAHRNTCQLNMVTSDEEAILQLENYRKYKALTFVAIDTKYGSGMKWLKEHQRFHDYIKTHYQPISTSDHFVIYNLNDSTPD